MRRVLCIALFCAALVVGCTSESRGTIDSPIQHPSDNKPAEIVNMPDRFLNLATKCNHGNRLYSHTRQAAPIVVPQDPSCPQETAR